MGNNNENSQVMPKKKMKLRKKIGIGIFAFFSVVLVAACCVGTYYYDLVTNYLQGSGITISGQSAATALEYSDSLCKEIVEEGTVLLQNKDDFLPVSKSDIAQVNVFGWRGTNTGWIGGGSGSVNANNYTAKLKVRSLLDALEASGCEYNTELTDICENYCAVGDGKALNDGVKFFTLKEPGKEYYTDEVIARAVDYSDTAIVVFGRQGGEGVDLPNYQLKYAPYATDSTRGYLDISTQEEELLEIVTTHFENVIVVVDAVNIMNMNFLQKYENIDACVWVSGTGQSGAYGLLRVLRGKVTPSAKLPDTIPMEYRYDPSFQNVTGTTGSSSSITYAENIYVGYRWYETADEEGYYNNFSNTYQMLKQDGSIASNTLHGYNAAVNFPFGFGLSYTSFEWEVEEYPSTAVAVDGTTKLTFKVKVTNVGDRKGKDVVELYASQPYTKGGIEKAARVLAGYAKTQLLLPGDSETLTISVDMYDLASYDCYDDNDNGFYGYELEAGNYKFSFRTDAHNLKEMSNSEITYKLNNTVKFDKDPETGKTVENKFTRYTDAKGTHKPYADCAIDGSDCSQDAVVYLTRADFATTFPTKQANRNGGKTSSGASYVYDPIPETTMPTTSSGGSLRLYTQENGAEATAEQLTACEGIIPNKELMLELGGNYDSPKWNQLVDQLSMDDMDNLIQLGGYKTCALPSIGKKYMFDNDGGSGLNRHIQEADGGNNPDRTSWTLFPSTDVLTASWDLKLCYNYGLAIAAEGTASGIDGWYSPSCNMHRSMYDGRISEYPSEDPFLSGQVTAQQCQGALNNGMYTYVKHFCVNENENGRGNIYTWLTEQSLRELYLKPYEYAVKDGHTPGIMAAMNRVGATYAKYNGGTIDGVLRGEWDFHGCVITDWEGSGNMKSALYAGLDLWLTGAQNKIGTFEKTNPTFVREAKEACKHILFCKAYAYYCNQTHDKSQDVISADTDVIVAHEVQFGWWYLGLWCGTGAVVIGAVVYTLFATGVIKVGKKKTEEADEIGGK